MSTEVIMVKITEKKPSSVLLAVLEMIRAASPRTQMSRIVTRAVITISRASYLLSAAPTENTCASNSESPCAHGTIAL